MSEQEVETCLVNRPCTASRRVRGSFRQRVRRRDRVGIVAIDALLTVSASQAMRDKIELQFLIELSMEPVAAQLG